jgi:hypothetical protein
VFLLPFGFATNKRCQIFVIAACFTLAAHYPSAHHTQSARSSRDFWPLERRRVCAACFVAAGGNSRNSAVEAAAPSTLAPPCRSLKASTLQPVIFLRLSVVAKLLLIHLPELVMRL